MNELTINALVCANSVLIPAQADEYSLNGLKDLAASISDVRQYYNQSLSIAGILFCRFNARSNLGKESVQIAEQLAQALNTVVFKPPIRETVAVKEAQAQHKSIFEYAPAQKAAQDYKAFTDELLSRI